MTEMEEHEEYLNELMANDRTVQVDEHTCICIPANMSIAEVLEIHALEALKWEVEGLELRT